MTGISSVVESLMTFALCLLLPAVAAAQLTSDESKLFQQLLAEPDEQASFDRRLKLLAAAIERSGDPKQRPVSYILVDLKRARIPAAQGVPFLLERLGRPPEAIQRTALRMLGAYGLEAKAAAPALIDLMRSGKNLQNDATAALGKIAPDDGEAAAAVLDRLGADGDGHDRVVLQTLALMAAVVPKSAVTRLEPYLDHRSTDMALLGHTAIGKILNLKKPGVAELQELKAIDWRRSADRGYATLTALAEAGSKAGNAVPLLLDLIASAPPACIECAALETAAKIQSGDPRLIAVLFERATAKDMLVRTMARMALATVDLKEPASVGAVARGLRHSERMVQLDTAALLRRWDDNGKLSPAALDELLPPLVAALQEVNEQTPTANLTACLMLLRRFGPRAAPVAEALERMIRSEAYFQKQGTIGANLRAMLLAALVNIGLPESARPLLLDALRKGPTHPADGGYAFTAAAHGVPALAAADASAAPACVPLLLPALQLKAPERSFGFIDWSGPIKATSARLAAIRALGQLGLSAVDALPELRRIADSDASPVALEARQAFNAIARQPGSGAELLPFVSGDKDFLHLDERLQVKMTMKLRNPRPQHVLQLLQQATKVSFTLGDHIDQDRPVWASIHSNETMAWNNMRRLATSTQARWEQTPDGYRLAGKPRPDASKAAKAPFPPFVDDTNDPLPKDPRLQVQLNVRLDQPRVADFLKLLHDTTGLTFTMESVDTQTPVFGGVNWSNTTAWGAMRSLAEAQRVQGTWEQIAGGYRLRGKHTPAPAPAMAALPAAAPAGPSRHRLWLTLAVVGFVTLLIMALALTWRTRAARDDA